MASLFIFFFAGGMEVSASSDGPTVERQLSWFESQGWWGVAILFIFSALYYAPHRFLNLGQNSMVYLFGLAAIALTILAMFSVGGIFIYSGFFVLLGLTLLSVELLTKINRAP
ncbi:MAG TPA: hypothetical protein VI688_08525 [Anaerolineales bacterium]|nr:hypothetical protein [Anaerolineales bacterium]HLE74276.1 hypothetical protein [Anaerolineales bacterium]